MDIEILEIDLRIRGKGCTQSPMIKLSQLLAKVEKEGILKVIASDAILPYKVLTLLAKRRGLATRVLERDDNSYVAIIGKDIVLSSIKLLK